MVKKLKTQEHYAKAGFSYHISVYITGSLDVNGKPQKHIHVHIVIMNEGVLQFFTNILTKNTKYGMFWTYYHCKNFFWYKQTHF